MTDKTIILHCGPHKTGSTYLQYELKKERQALAQAGWTYPEYGVVQFSQQKIHSWLSGALNGDAEVNEETFRTLLSQHERLIISSEDFIYLTHDQLIRLRNLLLGWRIQIILYIRSPVDLWPSHWQELIRHGWDITLLEYLANHAAWLGPMDGKIMDPCIQARKFSEIFGRDSIRMFCYENILDGGNDLFRHFWDKILGIGTPAPAAEDRRINASQPGATIELLRSLNELYIEQRHAAPRNRILAAFQKNKGIVEALPDYGDFLSFVDSKSSTILLDSRQEFFQVRERRLMHEFGERIENTESNSKLFSRQFFQRRIPYMKRYWVDRFGYRPFIDEVLSLLNPA